MSYNLDVVHVRLVKEASFYSEKPLKYPRDVQELMAKEMAEYDREAMCILNLTMDGKVINMNVASIGTINAALVSAREIFKCSILSNAAGIIMIHNHPSGNLEPSKEDILVTKKMIKCGELMGIDVKDHIIVGGRSGEIFSFQENELISEGHFQDEFNEIKVRDDYER